MIPLCCSRFPALLKGPAATTVAVCLAAAASLIALPAGAQPGAPAGCTGPASSTWLNVKIDGVRNSKGLIAVTLYPDTSSKFLAKHGSMYVGRVNAQSGTVRTCIFVPKTGVYAVAIYHDENSSQKFDRNGLGLPAEGYGFSNNPSTIGGLPSFRSVRLNVPKAGLTTQITMKYP
jgi:uncharacterized protein (DUF2141 family)